MRVSEGAIDADVRGKRTLRVCLRVEADRLASACTCAAKGPGPAVCRHVWATLLEVDRRGALAGLRTTQRRLALGVVAKAPRSARAKALARTTAAPPSAARAGP